MRALYVRALPVRRSAQRGIFRAALQAHRLSQKSIETAGARPRPLTLPDLQDTRPDAHRGPHIGSSAELWPKTPKSAPHALSCAA
jgi:hypothetical protein